MSSYAELPNQWILPPSWQWATIGEIADTTSGGTPRRDRPEFYGGTIPWVKSGELRDGVVHQAEESITEEALAASSAKIFPKGTVCIALYGATVGRLGILGIDASTNQAVCGIFQTDAVLSWFLFRFLQLIRRQLVELGKGGAQPNISQSIVRQTRVPVAPIKEQQRILDEIDKQFTRLDSAVAALKRVQTNLKRYRAAVLKAACEGRLVPTEAELAGREGLSYEPASVLLQRILSERRSRWEASYLTKFHNTLEQLKEVDWKRKYKEPKPPDTTDLALLPEGWVWTSAEQLSDETRAITYGVIKLGEEQEAGIPTLRSSDVRHLKLRLDSVKRISPTIANNFRRTFLRGGEILITVRGTLGGVVVVPNTCKGFNISREVAMIALVDEELGPAVAFFIGSTQLQNWLLRRTKGIAYTGINIETLKELPIPLPPKKEQLRIATELDRHLSVMEEMEAQVTSDLKRAERLRESILRRAFEGRLLPQDPNDEPADRLLDRIRTQKESAWHREPTPKITRKVEKEEDMPSSQASSKRNLLEVLRASKKPLPPEELFSKAGYDQETIDDFYAALKKEVRAGHVRETRVDDKTVRIQAGNK